MSALARRLLPDTADVGVDGWLTVGGCSIERLAGEFGTPLFVYDEAHLRARCREAVAAFGDKRRPRFADVRRLEAGEGRVCPACGTVGLPAAHRFCGACGVELPDAWEGAG